MTRSLLAVVLAWVVMLVAYRGGDVALQALAPHPNEAPDAVYFVFSLGTGFIFMMVGGYVAAMLAGRSELKHALAFGAVSIAASILEALLFKGEQPIWYTIALMFLSIPAALAGGYFRARQLKEERNRPAPAD